MRLARASLVSTALLTTVLAPAAFAQDAAPAPRTDAGFHLDLGADAWFPRLLGDVTSPGGAERDIKELDLRDSEIAFAGHARLNWDRCFAELAGFSFETDGNYTNGGDDFSTDFQWWAVSADVGYAIFTPFADQAHPWGDARYDRYGDNVNSNGDYSLDLRISPTLGVTYHDIELNDVNVTQSTMATTDGGWMSGRLGGEMQLWLRPGADFSFLKAVVVEASISAGPMFGVSGDASGTGLAVELEAGVRLMFLDNVGAHLGYRLFDGGFDGTDGSSDLSIGAYGLFAGVAIRF
jgi:hypothetical protein